MIKMYEFTTGKGNARRLSESEEKILESYPDATIIESTDNWIIVDALRHFDFEDYKSLSDDELIQLKDDVLEHYAYRREKNEKHYTELKNFITVAYKFGGVDKETIDKVRTEMEERGKFVDSFYNLECQLNELMMRDDEDFGEMSEDTFNRIMNRIREEECTIEQEKELLKED